MDNLTAIIIAIVTSVFASTGFWNWLSSRSKKKSDETALLLGLAHDRIVYLGSAYIERGWITKDEYENLHDYLFVPYEHCGGNGTAKKIMQDIDKLPMRKEKR